MVDVTPAPVTAADVEEWYKVKHELNRLKQKEALLRQRVFKGFFPEPKEGTNRHDLGEGYSLKATHEINRKVELEELNTLTAAMTAEGSNLPQLPMKDLIRWVPELVTKEYRKLSEDERKIFDQCLTIKPGSVMLEVDQPKRQQKAEG